MRRFLHDNSLSLVLGGLFVFFIAAQSLAGWRVFNQDQQEHGQPTTGYAEYVASGHFGEAVFENWESEFLQMAAFVWLSAFLYQKGASESKDPEGGPEEVDRDPRRSRRKPDAPWPVRYGGLTLVLYERSLSLALLGLFLLSFALHAVTGRAQFNQEQLEHGGAALSLLGYLGSSRFWFESFQNWQSEFLAVVSLALLSIVLRQRGSPQSKPVDAPYAETGA
jgi:hypothetical protein